MLFSLWKIYFILLGVLHYLGSIKKKDIQMIWTFENILSNKITAVIGRDNPKDIFDIYLISKFYTINWGEILKSAQDKSVFEFDDLIVRLKSFPPQLLKSIRLVDKTFLDNFENEFPQIIEIIQKEN